MTIPKTKNSNLCSFSYGPVLIEEKLTDIGFLHNTRGLYGTASVQQAAFASGIWFVLTPKLAGYTVPLQKFQPSQLTRDPCGFESFFTNSCSGWLAFLLELPRALCFIDKIWFICLIMC